MECGGLPPLLTAGACPCAANGGKPPLRKRRLAAALHTTARGLCPVCANIKFNYYRRDAVALPFRHCRSAQKSQISNLKS